jgi:hypothetical protein
MTLIPRNASYLAGLFNVLIIKAGICVSVDEWMDLYIEEVTRRLIAIKPDENCIVVLDEFPTHENSTSTDNLPKLGALIRDFCRVLRLGCILMGTDSAISNLVGDQRTSGTGGEINPVIRCHVFIKLPGVLYSAAEATLNQCLAS